MEGVNFSELFAPPTPTEIEAVSAEWKTRDVSARDYRVESSSSIQMGSSSAELRVVSHRVGSNRHYGAIVVPQGGAAGSLPVLVIGHGGDVGVDIDSTIASIRGVLSLIGSQFVYVIPSFRSEVLSAGGRTYRSEGEASPWDGDVDDALALLNVTLAQVPQADTSRIGVVGFSRGAGVALLMGVRDPRIDAVIDFFGPTDFFDPWVQLVLKESLQGNPSFLPGADALMKEVAYPLRDGKITMAQARSELVRRSSKLFVDRLPALQVHHGRKDFIVPVSQAESLIAAMQKAGRKEPSFQSYLYPEAGHYPSQEGLVRSGWFLMSYLIQPSLASR